MSMMDEDEAREGSHVGVAKAVGEAGPGDDNVSAVLILVKDYLGNELLNVVQFRLSVKVWWLRVNSVSDKNM